MNSIYGEFSEAQENLWGFDGEQQNVFLFEHKVHKWILCKH